MNGFDEWDFIPYTNHDMDTDKRLIFCLEASTIIDIDNISSAFPMTHETKAKHLEIKPNDSRTTLSSAFIQPNTNKQTNNENRLSVFEPLAPSEN